MYGVAFPGEGSPLSSSTSVGVVVGVVVGRRRGRRRLRTRRSLFGDVAAATVAAFTQRRTAVGRAIVKSCGRCWWGSQRDPRNTDNRGLDRCTWLARPLDQGQRRSEATSPVLRAYLHPKMPWPRTEAWTVTCYS